MSKQVYRIIHIPRIDAYHRQKEQLVGMEVTMSSNGYSYPIDEPYHPYYFSMDVLFQEVDGQERVFSKEEIME